MKKIGLYLPDIH